MLWSHTHNLALVACASNRPEHDIGIHLGLHIMLVGVGATMNPRCRPTRQHRSLCGTTAGDLRAQGTGREGSVES